tara:strand:+ start:104 stop:469 length:366 start_codon:yes stop_codon:yes gene_type:complete
MTVEVPEFNLTRQISINQPNLSGDWTFVLTSQYSHQPIEMAVTIIETNARFTTIEITFPVGFGDAHKNGVYNWRLEQNLVTIEAGLVKIITNPGGGLGTTNYTSTPDTEERVAEVFYRPNY